MGRIGQLVRGFITGYMAIAAVAAVVEQLGQPPARRTWHGQVAGVPYDFRRPTLARFRQAWWDPQNPHLVTPRGDFGLGWAIKVYRLTHHEQEQGR